MADDTTEAEAVGARAFLNGVKRPTTVEELGICAGKDLEKALAWLKGFDDSRTKGP